MTALQSILLGIIQGISEFLPISSDGHLVLFQEILGFEGGSLTFNVTLHAGTLLAILVFYFKDLIRMFDWRFIRLGIISSLPTAVIGLLMKKYFDFENTDLRVVAGFFFLSGLSLFLAYRKPNYQAGTDIDIENIVRQIDAKKALMIGIAQGLAVLPGLSRSGTTIATAVYMGCSGPVAAFYSFAIAIPAIFGACLLELSDAQVEATDVPYYILGAVVSFVIGLISLYFLKFLFAKNIKLAFFSYYLWALSVLLFIFG